MTSNFPTSADALSNPAAGDQLSNVTTPHAAQHANANDILEAIEAKLGLGASTPPASAAVLRRTGTGSSGWAQIAAGDYAAASIVNADVSASAAIAYSKLNLASSVVTGDIVNGTLLTADLAANAITQVGGQAYSGIKSTTSTTDVAVAGATVTLTLTGGPVLVTVTANGVTSTAAAAGHIFVYEAGALWGVVCTSEPFTTSGRTISMTYFHSGLAAGSTTFDVRWHATAGSTLALSECGIGVIEFKR